MDDDDAYWEGKGQINEIVPKSSDSILQVTLPMMKPSLCACQPMTDNLKNPHNECNCLSEFNFKDPKQQIEWNSKKEKKKKKKKKKRI